METAKGALKDVKETMARRLRKPAGGSAPLRRGEKDGNPGDQSVLE